MGIIFIISLLLIYFSEKMSNPNLDSLGLNANLGNLEGKEIRFGTDGSSLFSAVTTAFTTGSVNNMHDSLNPLSISATLLNMMLNVAFGGGRSRAYEYDYLCAFNRVYLCINDR